MTKQLLIVLLFASSARVGMIDHCTSASQMERTHHVGESLSMIGILARMGALYCFSTALAQPTITNISFDSIDHNFCILAVLWRNMGAHTGLDIIPTSFNLFVLVSPQVGIFLSRY